jgi:hypothetical protein
VPFLIRRLVLKPQLEFGERLGLLRGRNRQAFPFFLSRKSEETTFSASETAQKPLAYIFAGIWAVPYRDQDSPMGSPPSLNLLGD